MNALKKLFVFLLLAGFCATSYAAVSDIELSSCSVFSEGEANEGEAGGDTKVEDEEPECD